MIPSAKNHPLLRDGQSQPHRAPPGLDPASAPLDDRRLPELLAETRDVAGLIRYFDLTFQPAGTWLPFFEKHAIVQLALVARDTAKLFQTRTAESLGLLASADAATQRSATRTLAALIANEAANLASMVSALEKSSFGETISRALEPSIIDAVRTAVETIHAFLEADGPTALASAANSTSADFWGWSADTLAAVSPGPAPTFPATRAATNNAVRQLGRVRGFLSRAAAKVLVTGTFEDGKQPPHLGLMVACFQLFTHGQTAINDLLRRHLEYYYRDVVGFRAQPAQPDHAYVIFELARGVASHLVEAGTELIAGRDDAKQDIIFTLPRDASLNRARVDGLRTSYRTTADAWRSASVANSSDGLGADLPKDDLRWPPFGRATLPQARVGWAIAAPVLETTAGMKSFVVEITLSSDAASTFSARVTQAIAARQIPQTKLEHRTNTQQLVRAVDLAVTGPEGWYAMPACAVAYVINSRKLRIVSAVLDGDQPVVPYDSEIHLRSYDTKRPVLEILVRPGGSTAALFEGLTVETVHVLADVSGDTNLVLANDSGPLDPAKPFEPFGARPTSKQGSSAGSRFQVGSREIFSKRVTWLQFDVEWKDMQPELDTYYAGYFPAGPRLKRYSITTTKATEFSVELAYLDGGRWQSLGRGTQEIFDGTSIVVPQDAIETFAAKPDLPVFDGPSAGQQRGFMRFELVHPSFGFGHDRYPYLVSKEVARVVTAGGTLAEINKPITPTIARFAANYHAEETLDLAANTAANTLEFFHIDPHGEWRIAAGTDLTLAPVVEGDAAFFVGLADFAGGSNVSLLFHLADGSGDPFIAYPELEWSYLAGDTWKTFEPFEILFDSTLELRRTGLLTLTVPTAATTNHTRMPAGRVWLRALVSGDAAALNLAYDVIPQAAEVVFAPTELSDLTRLSTPLPAGTIKKLVVARPQVKKITQPLSSFDGAVLESGPRFHRRSHERLRHRNRAADLWDYERIVLQEFPSLHLVKCIPHATSESALAPGNTLVVVVPETNGAELLHPLKPAATQDVLEEVRTFLVTRASGLARIEVVNPLYEELQVIANVKLHAGFDLTIHSLKLAEELRGHLAPWMNGDTSTLRFTNEIYPSQILNFIEERPYVDFVTDFVVRQWVNGSSLAPDPTVLRATTARSVLTSHPTHLLTVA